MADCLTCFAQAELDQSPLVVDEPPVGYVDRFGDHEFSPAFIALLRRVQLTRRSSRSKSCGLVAKRSAATANPAHAAAATVVVGDDAAAGSAAAGSAAAGSAVTAAAAVAAAVVAAEAAAVEAAVAAEAAATDEPASAGIDADNEPARDRRVVGGAQEEADELPAQRQQHEGGPMALSLTSLSFDGPTGKSTHVAGPLADGGSCKLALSLAMLSGVATFTLTVIYFKAPQPEPEPAPGGADAALPPPPKRKAKPKKAEEDPDRALQCRFGVTTVLKAVQLNEGGGLALDLCAQLPLSQTR